MIRQLEAAGTFKVLMAIASPNPEPGTLRPGERLGLIVDTETTGLNRAEDEVVEIGMLAFGYDENDQFTRVISIYEGLREPDNSMSEDAANITGLTDEILKGKRLDNERIDAIVERSSVIIAHNAAFDRPMCERLLPSFASKPWACSATEVPWRRLGYEGAKLGYLLYQSGLFHSGHRALEDCYALLNVLTARQLTTERVGLQILLTSARETRILLEVASPYDKRAFFKDRGYRWAAHPVMRWHKELPQAAFNSEYDAIRAMGIRSESIYSSPITAFDRFKL